MPACPRPGPWCHRTGRLPGEAIWTKSRSRGLVTNFAVFGRLAASWAFHWATVARYSSFPPRVAALRRSSRLIVPGSLKWRAMWQSPCPGPSGSRSPHAPRTADSGVGSARTDRRHTASVTKPAHPDGNRRADRDRGLGSGHPRGDHPPKLTLDSQVGLPGEAIAGHGADPPAGHRHPPAPR